jgi:hypothetical protein
MSAMSILMEAMEDTMPDSAENRVTCHRAANARQLAGRPIWDWEINIKNILEEDPKNTSDAHASAVAKRIAALLRSRLPKDILEYDNEECDLEMLEIIEYMETLEPEDGNYGCSVLECLNDLLSKLYDWADDKRVWLD